MSNEEQFLDLSKFERNGFIGKGNFGQVYKVLDLETKEIYAAKITNSSYSLEEGFSENILFLFREIRIMSALNHPSIIRYIGYSAKDFDNNSNITIITEYAPNKSLSDIIQEENAGLSHKFWDQTKKLICIFGIASGIQYLHHNNVIHRDLKIDNILMDKDLNPKIGDFGLSKIYDTDLSQSLNMQSQIGQKGTPTHMAPEIITNCEYSRASDVYAFALIVYQIMCGTNPFDGFKSSFQLYNKIVSGFRPQILDIPDVYKELIEKCWSHDPKQRPSFDEIVDELKNDTRYIDELEGLIDEDQFLTYVDYIENYETTFDINSKTSIHLSTFLEIKKSKNIEPEKYQQKEEDEKQEKIEPEKNQQKEEDKKQEKFEPEKNQQKEENKKQEIFEPEKNQQNEADKKQEIFEPEKYQPKEEDEKQEKFEPENGKKMIPKYEIFFIASSQKKKQKLSKSTNIPENYYESERDHNLYEIPEKLELKILVEGYRESMLPVIKSLCHNEIKGELIDDEVSIIYDFHGKKYKLQYISTYSQSTFDIEAFSNMTYQSTDVCLLVFSKKSSLSINEISRYYNKIKIASSMTNPLFFLVGVDASYANVVYDKDIKNVEKEINPFKTCIFSKSENSQDELICSDLSHQIIIESYIENRMHLKSPELSFCILCVGDENEKDLFFKFIKMGEIVKQENSSYLQIIKKIGSENVFLEFWYIKLEDMINFKTEIDILTFVFPLYDRTVFDLIVNSWPEKMSKSMKQIPIILVGIANIEWNNNNNDNPQFVKWEEVEEFKVDKENICFAIKCSYLPTDFEYLKNMISEAFNIDDHKHKHKKNKKCNIF